MLGSVQIPDESQPQSPQNSEGIDIELAEESPVSSCPANDVQPIELKSQPAKLNSKSGEPPQESYRERPRFEKFQAIDYPVGGLEVKVDIQHVKETKSLWNIIARYVKRRLLIMDGYIYSLETEDYGFFVVGVWNLHSLRQVHLWPKQNQVQLVFQEPEKIQERQFRIDQGFDSFRSQLLVQLEGRLIE